MAAKVARRSQVTFVIILVRWHWWSHHRRKKQLHMSAISCAPPLSKNFFSRDKMTWVVDGWGLRINVDWQYFSFCSLQLALICFSCSSPHASAYFCCAELPAHFTLSYWKSNDASREKRNDKLFLKNDLTVV